MGKGKIGRKSDFVALRLGMQRESYCQVKLAKKSSGIFCCISKDVRHVCLAGKGKIGRERNFVAFRLGMQRESYFQLELAQKEFWCFCCISCM